MSAIIVIEEDSNIGVVTELVPGPPGGRGERGEPGASGGSSFDAVSATDLGGHRIVAIDANGQVNYASNATLAHANRSVGMTLSASVAGDSAFMKNFGEVTEPSWTWTPNLPLFLGVNGVMTQTPPVAPAAKFSMVVGFAVSSTSVFLNFREPFILTQ